MCAQLCAVGMFAKEQGVFFQLCANSKFVGKEPCNRSLGLMLIVSYMYASCAQVSSLYGFNPSSFNQLQRAVTHAGGEARKLEEKY